MKAIGLTTSLPVDDPRSLFELEVETPTPGPRDLLVRVRAVSLNPVDWKQRKRVAQGITLPEPRILGYDASGVVEAVGSEVTLFRPGDAVFYAGSMQRQGWSRRRSGRWRKSWATTHTWAGRAPGRRIASTS